MLAPACLRARFRERAAALAALYQADPQEAERLERQPAGFRVPYKEFAVEDQAVRELRGSCDQVRPAVLNQGPAAGLHQHPLTHRGQPR
ncbi:hypothetical protein [Streptomyces sp. NBC_01351]|uniref:hypothetical protein n=1 Tax=Streptomyces sp. NBC_01351 TaxID=2903833 RepID=UPI003FCC66BE